MKETITTSLSGNTPNHALTTSLKLAVINEMCFCMVFVGWCAVMRGGGGHASGSAKQPVFNWPLPLH